MCIMFIMHKMTQTHTQLKIHVTTRSATLTIIHLQSPLWVVNLSVRDHSKVRAQYLLSALMCWKELKQENRTEELSYFGQDGSLSHHPPKLWSIIGAIKRANRRQSAHLESSEWVDY